MLLYRYGEHPAQVAELLLPCPQARAAPGPPVDARMVVMLHGGFWRARYDRSLQDAVAADLTAAGWAVWNVDYRAVPPGPNDGGGWPHTQLDVASGLDLLITAAAEHGLTEAVARGVTVVGHSAGGSLALWAAARYRLPAGAPGSRPGLRPAAVIAQAAICDLARGARQGLGGGAVEAMMGGGPAAATEAYALASPAALLPLGLPVLLVTGDEDEVVPPVQARDFATLARAAGDDVTLEIVAGEGHFGHLDPRSASWGAARSWLRARSARMPG